MEIILFAISVLPVILIGLFIYRKDKDKESLEILLKLFIGGIFSCFLVLIISGIIGIIFPFFTIEHKELNLFQLFFSVFIGVALVEEFCKWFMVYKISYNHTEFDHLYDMIVYSVFLALGFACLENLFYVYQYGIATGILRALLAVPGHACDGVFMGYYLGLAKLTYLNNNPKLSTKYLIMSLLVPVILHGIYDYCIFTGKTLFTIIFFIFIFLLYKHSLKNIKQFASINRKLKYKDNYCPNCGCTVDSEFCPNCGRKND